VKETSEETKQSQPKEDQPDKVDVTVRTIEAPSPEAIAKEAERGYGLLFVGVESMRGREGFHPEVDRIAAAFDGPLAIVVGAGEHLKHPEEGGLEMLVPVNGTDVSRRAAEFAVEISRGTEADITALYVASRNAKQSRGARVRRQEKAILDEVKRLADLYDRKVETAIRADVAPDVAVVAAAKRNGHNLIIMGVNRRPGDQLFFGETAAGVFRDAPISLLFLAS
jgi:nucleotide-binding universal stress UspA family protein